MQNSENKCRTTPCKWLTKSPQSCCHHSLDIQPIRFSKFKSLSLCEKSRRVISQTCKIPQVKPEKLTIHSSFIHATNLEILPKYCLSFRNSILVFHCGNRSSFPLLHRQKRPALLNTVNKSFPAYTI